MQTDAEASRLAFSYFLLSAPCISGSISLSSLCFLLSPFPSQSLVFTSLKPVYLYLQNQTQSHLPLIYILNQREAKETGLVQ